jgi:hypothetical protein
MGFGSLLARLAYMVRLYSRPGNRFPLIVETLARLRSRSCIIDGEAVACDDNGVTSFDRVRYRRHDESIFLYAFDLIELNGDDLRRHPLERRKATLQIILAKAGAGMQFNEHMDGDGETVFRHACKLGLERYCDEAEGLAVPIRPLARLAQNEERRRTGGEARRGGKLGQKKTVITCLSANHSGAPWGSLEVCACYGATLREVS